MDLDTVINQSAIDHLYELFALATCLIFFWFIESVYRLDKRWLIPVIIFPPSLFMFIMLHWEESRGKCFFASLLVVLMLLIGGLVGYSFFVQILSFFKLLAFWPYYAYAYLSPRLLAML